MECFNLEQVMNAFRQYKIQNYNVYYSKICTIFEPDIKTLEFIINECKKDKTIIYTNNKYSGKLYFITKLIKNEYKIYKMFKEQKYDFTHYEENVLNSLNNNLITPKISSPGYFNKLPNTLLEKRKIDNDDINGSKKLKIITDVNEPVSKKLETLNISFKNGKIITNGEIKEIYNLEKDENEIYINDLLIGNMNDNNLQLSDEIVKKYKKLEFNVDDNEE